MRIGIDIDGVLTDIEKYQLKKGEIFFNKPPKNIKGYEITEIFGVTDQDDNNFWAKYLYKYAIEEKARKHASQVINKLKNDGNEIYIVTARYLTNRDTELAKQMREIVRNWLKENEIYYDETIFTPEDKLEACENNNIDIMIEDKVDNVIKISNVIPVICFNAGYNEHIKGNNIYRCYNWNDVYKIINDIK